ncbi:MAG TPA: hypothetical protein VM286_05910 [Candidatus Thermoplasmatota archaeon]|nr:hypothetical protein [Candidatus Thermoplasmatota archaeon]
MAEDKKADGYEFVPPDFDEDAFIHRELTSFKTTTILFVWGIVAAAASWAAFVAVGGSDMGWFIGLLLCAVFGYCLKFLYPRLGADIAHFKRKEWVGTGFLFFFTWLSFFVLAINPPVTDIAPPQLFVNAGPAVQEAGGAVTLDVVATDNDRVSGVDVQVFKDNDRWNVSFVPVGPDHIQSTLGSLPPGAYRVQAKATDAHGHTATHTTNFTVGSPLQVTWPAANAFAVPTDQVVVKVAGTHPCSGDYDKGRDFDCLRTVYLKQTDGTAVIPMEYHTDIVVGWLATANFQGWATGNHTYQVVAQYPDRFLAAQKVPGGEITSAPRTIDMRLTPGDHTVGVPGQPAQRTVEVPESSAPLLAVALLGLAFVVRRLRA